MRLNIKVKNKHKTIISLSVSMLFAVLIFSNLKEVKGRWEQKTLEERAALVVNIMDKQPSAVITVEYNVISGPGLDVYLRKGTTGVLLAKPTERILKYEDNSMEGHWTYTVENASDFSVVFINDGPETCVFRYSVTHRINIFLTNFPLIFGITVLIGGSIVIIVLTVRVIKRRKKQRQENNKMQLQ